MVHKYMNADILKRIVWLCLLFPIVGHCDTWISYNAFSWHSERGWYDDTQIVRTERTCHNPQCSSWTDRWWYKFVPFNQNNKGFGFSHSLNDEDTLELTGGFYYDSYYNWAKYVGFRLLTQDRYFGLFRPAIQVLIIQSPSEQYNDGNPFIAPIPMLITEYENMRFNAVFIPAINENRNVSAVGFQFEFKF